MWTPRPRVLIHTPEKALADVLSRGVGAIDGLDFDVTLEEEQAVRQLADCRYDLLLLGLPEKAPIPRLARAPGVPVVLVGGRPGSGEDRESHVPLPLSFTLLDRAVRSALDGRLSPADGSRLRRRDQVG